MRQFVKRLSCFAIASATLLFLTACSKSPAEPTESPASGLFTPGSYTATAPGKVGDITLSVSFSADSINTITIDQQNETVGIGDAALEQIPQAIIHTQSLAVDMISGATITSEAILTAVKDCVVQANGDVDALSVPRENTTATLKDVTTDVLVIGGGGAGLISAAFAAQAGAQVIVVEKQGIVGGNTGMSRGIFGCSASSYQAEMGISATKEEHLSSYLASYPNGNIDMLRILADKTGEAADWLISNGAEFESVNGNFTIVPKDHRLGSMIIGICNDLLSKYGVDVRTNTAGKSLLLKDGNIIGATVETKDGAYNIYAKSVIMATGGFSSNNEMVTQYNSIYEGLGYISSSGNTGDGHKMAEAIGAQLTYMDVMKCNPFLFYDEAANAYTMIGTYVNPGIVVTVKGQRIGNEHANYYFSPNIMALEDKTVYLIYNEAVRPTLEAPDVSHTSYATIEELSAAVGIDEAGLKTTLAAYAESAATSADEFGRTIFQTDLSEGPYYAVKLTPAMQGTFGGILIDGNANAYDTSGNIIPGLYAAGECAGDGLYGANPVPTDCVFGKIAGQNAAGYANSN